MSSLAPDSAASRSHIRDVVSACREWYAEGVASDRPIAAADVIASWRARFRPTAWPTVGGDWSLAPMHVAGQWVRDDRGLPAAVGKSRIVISSDRAGWYAAVDGRLIRDVDDALARSGAILPEIARMMRDHMPRSRRQISGRPSRKRHDGRVIARALVLAVLVPRLGWRPAARELLSWDPASGGAGNLDRADRQASAAAENSEITAAVRTWKALGIEVRTPR